MTLLLIRHGETPLNVARVLQPAATPLSAKGQAQAKALAQRLKGLGLAGILSSDLPRALQTAQAIGAATGLPVQTSALLHERNFGALRGQAYDRLGFDPLTRSDAPPEGESAAQFESRCQAAWQALLALQARLGGPLAVVSHGLVMRCWLQQGPLQLAPGMALPERLGNTALCETSAAPPHLLRRINCTAHLDGGVGEDAHSLSGG